MAVYDIQGNRIGQNASEFEEKNLNYDANVKSVNHRGYSLVAPENTLPAYKLSKKMGFNYVETDVSFTSDNIAMLLHDATIDRTSNGSGTLSEMTYEQVRQYDFGAWMSSDYAGTVIPTLDEFLDLCKSIMLHPYIELKSNGGYTQAQIEGIVDAVNKYGMTGRVTYISFSDVFLGYVKNYDSKARLGFLKKSADVSHIATIQGLQTGSNEVFYDTQATTLTNEICSAYANAGIPLEVWTVDDASTMLNMNKYVSGITSNNLIAGKVLYDSVMN